ncbi:MAG TPA: hypothetical protein VMH87_20120 [Pseudomonadales bacterium]|nr:hypothetical protein [Pseudomonadales bacterium]
MKWSSVVARMSRGGVGTILVILCAVLIIMMYGVFVPGQVLFSNDGPLGRLMTECHRLPGRFFGCWMDLNNVGFNQGSAPPGISFGLLWLLGPVLFSKFYAMISLFILGLGAWFFFRELRLSPAACVLGALAAILNSILFSLACWGLGAQIIAAGMVFFAMAALSNTTSRHRWLLVILAGFAVGMDVTEAADVGAIFSVLVAAFAIYQSFIAEGPLVKNLATGAGRLILVVLFAGFLAVQTIHGLIATDIQGVKGTQQDAQTKADRWGWATQWSLPKTEALGIVVPGLFGYRMNTPNGGEYWGITGQDPGWQKYLANGQQGTPPTTFFRYSGGGNYIGQILALVGIWAALQSFRRNKSVFSPYQRKWVWFWAALTFVSLLLSFGHYAPFYRLLYALPYFSTIRNPTKFLYLFSFGFTVLFAYGIDGLWRKYLKPAGADAMAYRSGLTGWWKKTGLFEKIWVWACAVIWVAGLIGWYVYAQHRSQLVTYLQSAHLEQPAAITADFSIAQPIWFAVFFFLAAALLVLIFSGTFAGKRAATGVILLGTLLVADLGLADSPWVAYWNYPEKYTSNPIIDMLRDKPYENRAVIAPIAWPNQMSIFKMLYKAEWMEQQFPYYNIQTFDVMELPRVPEDIAAFQKELNKETGVAALPHFARSYQLTNTRYLFAPIGFSDFWNTRLPQYPLQLVTRFSIVPKPGLLNATKIDEITVAIDPVGIYGLFSIPSVLPRAKLYTHWQVNTNAPDTLDEMFSTNFNPHASVLVAGDAPDNSSTNVANPPDDAVQYVSYAPKDIVLKADAPAPSVLLLSDHFHPDWKVLVDGAPQKVLRCNFLMRGVYLLPGTHTIEFKFQPANGLFFVSLAAVIVALLALGTLITLVIKSQPVPVTATAPVVPTLPPPPAANKPGKAVSRKKTQRK